MPSANAIKMKFARFGAPFAPTTGGVVSGHVTTTPSVNPRKRDRDSDSGPSLLVGREVKRSRHDSPPVQVQNCKIVKATKLSKCTLECSIHIHGASLIGIQSYMWKFRLVLIN